MLEVSVECTAIFFNIISGGKSYKIVLELSNQCACNSDTWTHQDLVFCILSIYLLTTWCWRNESRGQLKCDGTRAENRFRLSAKRTSPFKSAGGRQFSRLLAAEVCASAVVILDTPCSEVVWSGTGYPLHSPVSPSLPQPCVTVCHHITTGLYEHCWISLVYSLGFILPR